MKFQKELAERKRRNADWLGRHASELQKLSQKPFNSVEMWTLHWHFFSLSIAPNVGMETNRGTVMHAGATAFSFPFENEDRSNSAMMSSEGEFFAKRHYIGAVHVVGEPKCELHQLWPSENWGEHYWW